MTTRRLIVLAGALLVGCWTTGQVTSRSLAEQSGEPGKPDAAQAEAKALNIRYAQANLKLMEARLAEMEERNRKVPNTIRPAAVQLLQESVAKARERVELVKGDDGNESRIYVVRAEAELRLAEENLKRAQTVNQRRPNTIIAGEIARLTASRDLAAVRVEKARHLALESPLANLQFEIDELRDTLQELRFQESMSRRGS